MAVRSSKKRAAQRKRNPPNPWLVLRRSKIHGRGVVARKDIPKGTRLIEYTGEVIDNAEADRRYDDDSMSRHHTFLFILNSRWCVDAAVGGNIARFINHKCDPNCVAWIEGKHIWIDALKDIKAGEELGYEYEYDFDPEYTIEDLAFYGCRCGSPKCRGTIVDVPKSKWHLVRELRRRMRAGRKGPTIARRKGAKHAGRKEAKHAGHKEAKRARRPAR